jgi:predicted Zn-dependent protease
MKPFAFIFILFLLIAGCTTPRPISVRADFTLDEAEKVLWRNAQEVQHAFDGSGLLYQDPDLERYLNQVVAKLQPLEIPPNISLQVKVIQDPSLNALALPNGVIYVHTGILARIDNEAQLAALLAHEMVHCIHRHALQVLESTNDRSEYFSAVREILARIGMGQQLVRLLDSIGLIGYTRELELEADRLGLDLMARAEYDIKEALGLFAHLQEEIKSQGIKEPFLLGTHPNVQQRIDTISHWLAFKHTALPAGKKNTEVFLSQLQRVILNNARLDLRLGRFSVAQRGLEKYLRIQPEDADAYFLMGEICRQREQENDAETAKKYYKKAIALNPSNPEPHKAMGLIHYKEGAKPLAKKYFESCLLLAPNSADMVYIQGYLKSCMSNGGV